MNTKSLNSFIFWCICASVSFGQGVITDAETPLSISGVYPHLAYWNSQGECGTGAVVPWANKLWVITYSPHSPNGSDDKLYEIGEDLKLKPFAGSVGGTPANRFVHAETNQLVIGPYVINGQGEVRVIPPSKMFGRLTGNARHLLEPHKKIYYATMEEGFYEVDMETLAVRELFVDVQPGGGAFGSRSKATGVRLANLPGYHGKGLFSGQGRLIYSNNGEDSNEARKSPDIPSGCLAEWDGKSDSWNIIRRNQFTDVRGPSGQSANSNPETDPVWAIGWDHRSLILMLLDDGKWTSYRLPKASHTYDGAHGWNTEWPRFQDIGESDLALTMHGMFWRFPKTFSRKNSSGIAPRSTYLKVIGDYCRWKNQLVFGCDDTAKSEFLNTGRAKGKIEGPGQSHSNLWFAKPEILDQLGSPIGRGAVWVDEAIAKESPSEPYLFSGFENRSVCIANASDQSVTFTFEIDERGNDQWRSSHQITVGGHDAKWHSFPKDSKGVWVRVVADRDCSRATVQFHYSSSDSRTTTADPIFDGIANAKTKNCTGALIRVRGENLKSLAVAATRSIDGEMEEPQYYELGSDMQLKPIVDSKALHWTLDKVQIPNDILSLDAASVVYIDDEGKRWRLPRGDNAFDSVGPFGKERIDREVATERDLFNCHGTFYELPARNAGGFSKVRPICTHNRRIHDYCSYRGLLIISGLDAKSLPSEHILRSADGKIALWAGVVDDLWRFGKPRGFGGPWKQTSVVAKNPSDPYLLTGFDRKSLTLSSTVATTMHVEVDITGNGHWQRFQSFPVTASESLHHEFPSHFQGYWLRLVSDADTIATGQLIYE